MERLLLKDETYGLNVEIADVDLATCDIDALTAGTNQDNANRKKVHVLRIGDRKDPAYTKVHCPEDQG